MGRNALCRRLFIGKLKRLVAHIDGKSYDVSIQDVRAIREGLGLTQEAFAARLLLSRRTVQQWEQRRATPDMPARILSRAIEQNPEAIAAAVSVKREMKG
ncbi:MAG: helix-turn-helix domain-containing protein [Vulcanimicrobiaceae bacterium]